MLNHKISLELHLLDLLRRGSFDPLDDFVTISLRNKQSWNTNTTSSAIIAHDNSRNVFFLPIVNDDDHRATHLLDVSGLLDKTALFVASKHERSNRGAWVVKFFLVTFNQQLFRVLLVVASVYIRFIVV